MIKDTIALSGKIQYKYIKKLLKNNVLTTNENGTPVITGTFHKAFNSMDTYELTEIIEKMTSNNDFLTKMIRLGGCLIVFGVPKNELFHSLNIVAHSIDYPNCRNQDSKNILEWINRCFSENILKKIQVMKYQKKKSSNNFVSEC